jgi:hypothetical protein
LAKRGGPVEFVDRLGGNRDDSETARRRYEAIAALLARHLNAPP